MLFGLSLLFSSLAVLFLQRLSAPRHFTKAFFADVFALFLGASLYVFFVFLFKRPLLALVLTILFFLLLAIITQAKQRALRNEALLFSDLTLLSQVLHFPKLYLPFLPWRQMLAGLICFCPVLFCLWAFTPVYSLSSFWLLLFLPFILPLLAFWSPAAKRLLSSVFSSLSLCLSPKDAQIIGPLATGVLQSIWHFCLRGVDSGIRGKANKPFAPLAFSEDLFTKVREKPEALADLILIQEESFCDPRRFTKALPPDFFHYYDALANDGQSFELDVHAYGAYTMRTEYEVLTGIEAKYLGTDAFHPYWSAQRFPSWSLAHFFKSLGYRTLCVHPFASSFFYRDKALPNLGFDAFLSLDTYSFSETYGPYVSDLAVAHTILTQLSASEKPLFCFAITMENHGPWREGRLAKNEIAPYETLGFPVDVASYLVHLNHADAMLGVLARGLSQRKQGALLCVYGDHLPALPHFVSGNTFATPCLLWKNTGLQKKERGCITPASLGGVLL
ncbi:MAG: LTA synthase family protein, partial [Desulfovibrio sp.]|nr:LTA synthase family protein [Desulfovibrio sp.]